MAFISNGAVLLLMLLRKRLRLLSIDTVVLFSTSNPLGIQHVILSVVLRVLTSSMHTMFGLYVQDPSPPVSNPVS